MCQDTIHHYMSMCHDTIHHHKSMCHDTIHHHMLCSTGDLHIGEAIMNDHIYDIGMSLRDKSATDRIKWKQNKLGNLLMTERNLLKNTIVQ